MYAPGTGGQHLSNILSTASGLKSRASVDFYKNHTAANAHVSETFDFEISNAKPLHHTTGNVLCTHWAQYYWAMLDGLVQPFPNRQLIVIPIPAAGTLAFKRFRDYCPVADDAYLLEEQRSLYTVDMISRTFGETDFHIIPAEWVFCESLDTLCQYADEKMHLSLDLESVDIMHACWYQRLCDLMQEQK